MFHRTISGMGAARLVDGFFAVAEMPVRIGPELAETAFVKPLARALSEAELGRVAKFEITRDEKGEPVRLTISLSLTSDRPGALRLVATMLEQLDAPAGSEIGNAECPDMIRFGKSYGLGLYLAGEQAGEDDRLDILEACTDALEGAGIYQGSVTLGDRTALYFYGDSFNRMRQAMAFVLSTDPRCKDAYARRLN